MEPTGNKQFDNGVYWARKTGELKGIINSLAFVSYQDTKDALIKEANDIVDEIWETLQKGEHHVCKCKSSQQDPSSADTSDKISDYKFPTI